MEFIGTKEVVALAATHRVATQDIAPIARSQAQAFAKDIADGVVVVGGDVTAVVDGVAISHKLSGTAVHGSRIAGLLIVFLHWYSDPLEKNAVTPSIRHCLELEKWREWNGKWGRFVLLVNDRRWVTNMLDDMDAPASSSRNGRKAKLRLLKRNIETLKATFEAIPNLEYIVEGCVATADFSLKFVEGAVSPLYDAYITSRFEIPVLRDLTGVTVLSSNVVCDGDYCNHRAKRCDTYYQNALEAFANLFSVVSKNCVLRSFGPGVCWRGLAPGMEITGLGAWPKLERLLGFYNNANPARTLSPHIGFICVGPERHHVVGPGEGRIAEQFRGVGAVASRHVVGGRTTSGKVLCANCHCVVNPHGHASRCVYKTPRHEEMYEARVWIGSAQHRNDVVFALLDRYCEVRRDVEQEMCSVAGVAKWMREMRYHHCEDSDKVLARNFWAAYDSLKPGYFDWFNAYWNQTVSDREWSPLEAFAPGEYATAGYCYLMAMTDPVVLSPWPTKKLVSLVSPLRSVGCVQVAPGYWHVLRPGEQTDQRVVPVQELKDHDRLGGARDELGGEMKVWVDAEEQEVPVPVRGEGVQVVPAGEDSMVVNTDVYCGVAVRTGLAVVRPVKITAKESVCGDDSVLYFKISPEHTVGQPVLLMVSTEGLKEINGRVLGDESRSRILFGGQATSSWVLVGVCADGEYRVAARVAGKKIILGALVEFTDAPRETVAIGAFKAACVLQAKLMSKL